MRIISLSYAVTLSLSGALPAAYADVDLSSGPYEPQAIGIDELHFGQSSLSVGPFSPRLPTRIASITNQVLFECSFEQGLISTSDYSQFSDYIRAAFIDQLTELDLYIENTGIQLSGDLLNVELIFNTLLGESASSGTWIIQLRLRSSLGDEETFSVGHSYPIARQDDYCQIMAKEFMTSVQVLMVEILNSKKFIRLVRPVSVTFR